MNSVDEINKALNLKVAEEVEKRAHDWLVAAQGIDWTEMYESALRENARLRSAYTDVMEHYKHPNHDHNWAYWVTERLRQAIA